MKNVISLVVENLIERYDSVCGRRGLRQTLFLRQLMLKSQSKKDLFTAYQRRPKKSKNYIKPLYMNLHGANVKPENLRLNTVSG